MDQNVWLDAETRKIEETLRTLQQDLKFTFGSSKKISQAIRERLLMPDEQDFFKTTDYEKNRTNYVMAICLALVLDHTDDWLIVKPLWPTISKTPEQCIQHLEQIVDLRKRTRQNKADDLVLAMYNTLSADEYKIFDLVEIIARTREYYIKVEPVDTAVAGKFGMCCFITAIQEVANAVVLKAKSTWPAEKIHHELFNNPFYVANVTVIRAMNNYGGALCGNKKYSSEMENFEHRDHFRDLAKFSREFSASSLYKLSRVYYYQVAVDIPNNDMSKAKFYFSAVGLPFGPDMPQREKILPSDVIVLKWLKSLIPRMSGISVVIKDFAAHIHFSPLMEGQRYIEPSIAEFFTMVRDITTEDTKIAETDSWPLWAPHQQ